MNLNPDVRADVCLLSNSALSERGGNMFVVERRNRIVVQERAQWQQEAQMARKANG